MGRGIVHPVDAMHTLPWDEDLLDFLAVHLADNGYDLKQTIELICTSEIYQARTPSNGRQLESGAFVFRGPAARRMTAEQFVDAVWQVTGASPRKYDAQIVRAANATESDTTTLAQSTQWIWSYANASQASPGGETITFRYEFTLEALPENSAAVITCDNEYALFVNGQRANADNNWATVEAVPLQRYLRPGKNMLLVAAKNGGDSPNPAGLLFRAVLRQTDQAIEMFQSDATWQWTSAMLDEQGRFVKGPTEWQPAVPVANQDVWAGQTAKQVGPLLAAGMGPYLMVRASLLKNNHLMKMLGRPNRDQIVTSRPTELTTLEAIDLANGQTLADAITLGAARRVAESTRSPGELTSWLFQYSLSREPTHDERMVCEELLRGVPKEQAVQDMMWSLFMLPEFQLVR